MEKVECEIDVIVESFVNLYGQLMSFKTTQAIAQAGYRFEDSDFEVMFISPNGIFGNHEVLRKQFFNALADELVTLDKTLDFMAIAKFVYDYVEKTVVDILATSQENVKLLA